MNPRITYLEFALNQASLISQIAHKDQKYGQHDYYLYHVLGVVSMCDTLMPKDWHSASLNTPEGEFRKDVLTTAYLHDVLEDSSYTYQNLIDNGIPKQVADAVQLLSKDEDTVIKDYLIAIKNNDIAFMVKKADMTFNMMNNIKDGGPKGLKRFVKYSGQMKILLGEK